MVDRAEWGRPSCTTALTGGLTGLYGEIVSLPSDLRDPARLSSERPEPGPLLFARFALPPNQLGYCGGDEANSLLQHIAAGVVDEDLVRQCRDFEGAYPYLRLIAAGASPATGSSPAEPLDPLDRAVVEGYWLGGPALGAASSGDVGPRFATQLETRFRARTPAREWPWLAAKPAAGALPHHSFHVLEVLPRVGLMRGGIPSAVVPTLEQCLIRPARVVAVEGDLLRVRASRLSLRDGRFVLDGCEADGRPPGQIGALADGAGSDDELVTWRADGTELIPDPRPGDTVALHWGWACDRLTPREERRLLSVTQASVARANATV